MSSLRIAVAQLETCTGDIAANCAAVGSWCERAQDAGSDVVVFPALTIPGANLRSLALDAGFRDAVADATATLAQQLDTSGMGDLIVIIGTLTPPDDALAQQAVVLHQGQVRPCVTAPLRVATKAAPDVIATVGMIDVQGHQLAIHLSSGFDSPPQSVTETGNVCAVIDLNLVPFTSGIQDQRIAWATTWAKQCGASVVHVNQIGGHDDLVFDGGSIVVEPSGRVLARAHQFTEELLIWDVDSRGSIATPNSELEQLYHACVTGLRSYVIHHGFRSVILGLSGGIDSAVVASMAADAIGGTHVVGVSMPSQYSSTHSRDDAADIAARLHATYLVHPIEPMVEAFHRELSLTGVAAENLQARVRGMILMSLSNMGGHLVLATGNKTELAVGYSTIYGDAVGGYAPLKDVDKSTVWALARWRNNAAIDAGEIPPIPESSITKPPSAELRPGQVDQDSLPAYEVLDAILALYLSGHRLDSIVDQGFEVATVHRVVDLVTSAEWKRRQYPPGPQVSDTALGQHWDRPITMRWRH